MILTGFNPLSSITKREICFFYEKFKPMNSFNPLSSITKREIQYHKVLSYLFELFQSTLFNYEERNK